MPDEASQRIEIPVCLLWQPEERVRLHTAGLQPGNATPGRVKELTGAAERKSKGLLKFAYVSKLGAQAVDELEGCDFPLDRQHVRLSSGRRLQDDGPGDEIVQRLPPLREALQSEADAH